MGKRDFIFIAILIGIVLFAKEFLSKIAWPAVDELLDDVVYEVGVNTWLNQVRISYWIDHGLTASTVYAGYEYGLYSYLAGYQALNDAFNGTIGNPAFPIAGEWASEQLEEYSSYGD